MTGEQRAELDEKLRPPIREALTSGASPDEIVYLLTRMLPELVDRRAAHGHVEAAYDLRNSDLDRSVPMETGPFEPVDL